MTRDVFYIAGYDPRGFRFYYSIFKKNLLLHSKDETFTLSKSFYEHPRAFWTVESKACKSTYHFLSWNDIVRQNWHTSLFSVLRDCLIFFKAYLLTGLFIKFAKKYKISLIAGFYPFFYVIFSYFLMLVGIFLLFYHLSFFLALFSSLLFFYLATKLIFKVGNKLAVFWLCRIYIFAYLHSKDQIANLNERIKQFTTLILAKLEENKDKKDYELIICSHSVGTILAISVIAACLKEDINKASLKILSLGECIPMLSYQKEGFKFKEDLNFLAKQDLIWFDFSSKIDGACFYKFNFFNQDTKTRFLSAQFHKIYTPKSYKMLKRNKYKAHFLYIMKPELKGIYDFFNFTVSANFLENKIPKGTK